MHASPLYNTANRVNVMHGESNSMKLFVLNDSHPFADLFVFDELLAVNDEDPQMGLHASEGVTQQISQTAVSLPLHFIGCFPLALHRIYHLLPRYAVCTHHQDYISFGAQGRSEPKAAANVYCKHNYTRGLGLVCGKVCGERSIQVRL